jgi:type I restriction-modification system DNA methylase subunit
LYNVSRNNFYDNQKRSTIYTPQRLSQFLFDLVKDKIEPTGLVLDPCVGGGSLLAPFAAANFRTIGIDITDQGWPDTHLRNYLDVQPGDYLTPA